MAKTKSVELKRERNDCKTSTMKSNNKCFILAFRKRFSSIWLIILTIALSIILFKVFENYFMEHNILDNGISFNFSMVLKIIIKKIYTFKVTTKHQMFTILITIK